MRARSTFAVVSLFKFDFSASFSSFFSFVFIIVQAPKRGVRKKGFEGRGGKEKTQEQVSKDLTNYTEDFM